MRSKSITALTAAAFLFALFAPALASATGDVTGATITNINTNQNGILVFFTDISPTTAHPACATSSGWSINTTTLAGQAVAATVHTAMAAGLKVDIAGLGICREYSMIETASYVVIRR